MHIVGHDFLQLGLCGFPIPPLQEQLRQLRSCACVGVMLENLAPAGRLIVNAIRKEGDDKRALLEIDYAAHLWREKTVQSVANVTRMDVRWCLDLAAALPSRPTVSVYPLEAANQALADLKRGGGRGARVLSIA